MATVHSFPALASLHAKRLVLGSMPGVASLAAQQYYAHPRNAFWRVIEAALALPAGLSYEERCDEILKRDIAVWDVLKTCTRSGSLDSAIDSNSIVANDFAGFLAQHPRIELICFNGAKAAEIWRRHIAPTLAPAFVNIRTVRLPSTSPAHAGMPLAEKIARWQQVLNPEHAKPSQSKPGKSQEAE